MKGVKTSKPLRAAPGQTTDCAEKGGKWMALPACSCACCFLLPFPQSSYDAVGSALSA